MTAKYKGDRTDPDYPIANRSITRYKISNASHRFGQLLIITQSDLDKIQSKLSLSPKLSIKHLANASCETRLGKNSSSSFLIRFDI